MQRIRDPIHGLISFSDDDAEAWKIIDAPEFQRLRRVRQLGFSEFTFPSATHTRFAHSIGVFHNARRLMNVVKALEADSYDRNKADLIQLASLLHDIGHGPFSHAFEEARKRLADQKGTSTPPRHEFFSAEIIRQSPHLTQILGERAKDIARIIGSDEPRDIYDGVLSSSFDADRLDFLVRDRYMTGTGAGAIDVDWLIDNLDIHEIPIGQDDDPDPKFVKTFVFKSKGRQAAEDFLLARYRLYTEVYLHKTTRGFEMMLSRLLCMVGDSDLDPNELGLDGQNDLVRFLREIGSVDQYLRLDDYSVWAMVRSMQSASNHRAKELADRLMLRDHLHVLDLLSVCGRNAERLRNAERKLDWHFESQLHDTIFKDEPKVSLYSVGGADIEKAHKVVRVVDNGNAREITDFDETIISSRLTQKQRLIRYYFLTREVRDEAHKLVHGG